MDRMQWRFSTLKSLKGLDVAGVAEQIAIAGKTYRAIFIGIAMAGMAVALSTVSEWGQSAKDVKGATPLVAIQNEAPAKLTVDPPIAEQLALGRVFIQYRTENLRVVPVFGKAALEVSPRIGTPALLRGWPILAHCRYQRRNGGPRGIAARAA